MSCAASASCTVLPQADLIGQHEARAVRAAVRVEGQLHEVLLMLPEPDLLAVDRRFDHHRGGIGRLPPVLDAAGQHVPGHERHPVPARVLGADEAVVDPVDDVAPAQCC